MVVVGESAEDVPTKTAEVRIVRWRIAEFPLSNHLV
jgi:hypothetical protein